MTQIITDSVADLEPEELERLDVACVPISVSFGERSYKENLELSKEGFYRLLRESPDFPARPSPRRGISSRRSRPRRSGETPPS